jgi:hypothetical protein
MVFSLLQFCLRIFISYNRYSTIHTGLYLVGFSYSRIYANWQGKNEAKEICDGNKIEQIL